MNLKWLFKLFVAVAILTWLVSHSDLRVIATFVAMLSPVVALVSAVMYALGVLVATVKWRVLLPERTLGLLLRLNLMAQFYGLFVPGQIGAEAIKAYQLGKGRHDAERVAASVFLDKVTGLIAVLVLGLGGAALTALPIGASMRVSFMGILAVCIAVLFALRFPAFDAWGHAILAWARGAIPWAERLCKQLALFLESWRNYSARPSILLFSLLLGMVHQAIYIGIVVLLARKMGIDLPVYEWCWVFAVVSIAVLVPVTPAGAGTREGAFVGSLTVFGIGIEPALAISFSLFAMQLMMGGLGAYVLLTRKSACDQKIDR